MFTTNPQDDMENVARMLDGALEYFAAIEEETDDALEVRHDG